MEKISEALKESQAIDPPAPSMTLKVCLSCGSPITNRYYDKCSDCRQKEQYVMRKKEAESILGVETEKQRDLWFEEIELPGRFVDKADFKTFDSKLQPRAYEAIRNFNGKSIVLSSPSVYGVGKTHLVCCLIWRLLEITEAVTIRFDGELIRHKCPAFFITENSLLSRIRATYNRNFREEPFAETEDSIYQKLSRYELLIIDDVGKVRPRDFSFLQGVYFRIIDGRYTSEQPVIITTNLSLPELEEHIGGASADRLREMCPPGNFVVMKGTSYRKKLGAS